MSRSIFLLLPTLCLFYACNRSPKNNTPRITHVVSLGGDIVCNDTTHYVLVKSVMINNTDDTVRLITMTCSYTSSYVSDSKQVSIDENICFGNYPTQVNIPPHKSFYRFIRLLVREWKYSNRDAFYNLSFKLGFNFVEDIMTFETDKTLEAEKTLNMKNVIWSNKIYLKDLIDSKE